MSKVMLPGKKYKYAIIEAEGMVGDGKQFPIAVTNHRVLAANLAQEATEKHRRRTAALGVQSDGKYVVVLWGGGRMDAWWEHARPEIFVDVYRMAKAKAATVLRGNL